MELANQYGINLGNIYKTVSDLKSADQERETGKIRQDMLSRQNTEDIAEGKADQDYLKDPKTAVAQSIAQKVKWGELDKQQREQTASALKLKINQHGQAVNSIMGITDPTQQQTALQQMVSSLPELEQQEYVKKYGATPQEWQANLPHTMNDLIVADGGITLLQKQAEAKTKHENVLEEKAVQGAIDYGKEELRSKNILAGKQEEQAGREKVANIYTESREKVAGMKGREGGKGSSSKPRLLNYEIKTKIDPKTGDKTTVRVNKWDDGSTTTSGASGELKPPPPLIKQAPKGATYKQSEVVRYGTKNGKKVAQMKDGSVIYVK